MANIITEVFVSLDGANYVKLDLHKDESLNLKFTKKDLQDLSKIFAPFSQGFTFPATPKNRAALGFFGDTDIIKINTESKFDAKLYTGGILNQTGFIKLENLAYRNKKPTDFSGSFTSTMTNLKDKIGDDYLKDLSDSAALVSWSNEGIQELLTSVKNLDLDGINIKHFVPLVSVNRVWTYDLTENSTLLDNIAYNQATPLDSSNLIKPEELRPAIYYSSILELIKKKYNLSIISPLEEREEYKDLTVWCNSERIVNNDYKILPILNGFGSLGWYDSKNEGGIPDPKKYTISTNLTNNTFTVNKRPLPFSNSSNYIENAFQFRVSFEGVIITGGTETPEVNIQYVRAADDVVFKTETFSLEGNSFNCVTQIDDELFIGLDSLEFYIKVQFLQPTSWSSCNFRIFFRYYDGKTGWFSRKEYAWYYYDSLMNNNSPLVSTDNIDLIKSLPAIKVADFLSSHFKAFNISVLDTSPDNESLFWLTPEDINSKNKVYSKAVLDYTSYVNTKEHDKEKPNDYNYYNFKHATSDYFSNKKYIEAFNLEYGQTVYPDIKPADPNEFKVETAFSIIPPINLKGTNIITAYGFTNDSPDVLATGETRYTPNYDELTLFYSHGSTECATLGYLGVKLQQAYYGYFIKVKGVYPLNNYIKVTPVSKNGYSFGFSKLKINGIEFQNSLYLRYYEEQTSRLLDPNVLSQIFELTLPPSEIYLNDSTMIQGAGQTPAGFRLQNDIIIGENLFSIVDAIIDVTTGEAKIKFLNY